MNFYEINFEKTKSGQQRFRSSKQSFLAWKSEKVQTGLKQTYAPNAFDKFFNSTNDIIKVWKEHGIHESSQIHEINSIS